ncbi:hypothetical protein QWZ10_00860 [Paracoccus cavernae]|uniref:Uncharacterized protein n=1 Tax=Paracoccus cavernae TaxID=1571207 RepID=A0ABT8D5N5_9RHOB|nr:hypothetical protein [Paracoccus cavernae]
MEIAELPAALAQEPLLERTGVAQIAVHRRLRVTKLVDYALQMVVGGAQLFLHPEDTLGNRKPREQLGPRDRLGQKFVRPAERPAAMSILADFVVSRMK